MQDSGMKIAEHPKGSMSKTREQGNVSHAVAHKSLEKSSSQIVDCGSQTLLNLKSIKAGY